jgi:hypothetical protein
MDQVLKDLMLEIADMDQQAGMQGMQGVQAEEEIADIMGKIYKVRPFGMKAVNMRELNPTGMLLSLMSSTSSKTHVGLTRRHGQARVHQGARNPGNSRHS